MRVCWQPLRRLDAEAKPFVPAAHRAAFDRPAAVPSGTGFAVRFCNGVMPPAAISGRQRRSLPMRLCLLTDAISRHPPPPLAASRSLSTPTLAYSR